MRTDKIMQRKVFLALFLVSTLAFSLGCKTTSDQAKSPASTVDLDRLANMMTGVFSSASQAAADPDNFQDTRLIMLPIWTTRTDGHWLYVEKALGVREDIPYKQRVYHLYMRQDQKLVCDIYQLPGDPLKYAGARRDLSAFSGLTPDSLITMADCRILFTLQADGGFSGQTEGKGCDGGLPGSRYTITELTISDSVLVSWEKGFNDSGKQVWGGAAGYRYIKEGN